MAVSNYLAAAHKPLFDSIQKDISAQTVSGQPTSTTSANGVVTQSINIGKLNEDNISIMTQAHFLSVERNMPILIAIIVALCTPSEKTVRQIKELFEFDICQSPKLSFPLQRRTPPNIEKPYMQKTINDFTESGNRQPQHSALRFLLLIGERKVVNRPNGYEKIKQRFLAAVEKMEDLIKKQDPDTQKSILAALASENCGIVMATLLGFEDCQNPNSEGQNANTVLQLSKEFFDNLCSEAKSGNLHVNLDVNDAIQACAGTKVTVNDNNKKCIEYFETLGEKFFSDSACFDENLDKAVGMIYKAQILRDLHRNKNFGLEIKIDGKNVDLDGMNTEEKVAKVLLQQLQASGLTAAEKLKALRSLLRYPYMQSEYARAIMPLSSSIYEKSQLSNSPSSVEDGNNAMIIDSVIVAKMNMRKILKIAISADGTEMRTLAIVSKSDTQARRESLNGQIPGGEDAYGMAFTHIKCDPEGQSEIVCAMMAVHT